MSYFTNMYEHSFGYIQNIFLIRVDFKILEIYKGLFQNV